MTTRACPNNARPKRPRVRVSGKSQPRARREAKHKNELARRFPQLFPRVKKLRAKCSPRERERESWSSPTLVSGGLGGSAWRDGALYLTPHTTNSQKITHERAFFWNRESEMNSHHRERREMAACGANEASEGKKKWSKREIAKHMVGFGGWWEVKRGEVEGV